MCWVRGWRGGGVGIEGIQSGRLGLLLGLRFRLCGFLLMRYLG